MQGLKERLKQILKEKSYEKGDFLLSSGKRSSYYLDCKQTTLDPEGAYLCGKVFFQMIQEAKKGVEAIGGPTLGADPIVAAVAVVSYLEGHPLRAFIVRKEPKGHGKGLWIEGDKGLRKGMKVAVVEDVVTTGASILRAIEVCEAFGLEVVQVLALVDREEGGREALKAKGYDLEAVFRSKDLVG